jgi:glycosyltransferase involved in cell wall biosynthesis
MKLLVLSFDYYPDVGIGALRTAALIEHLLKMQRSDIKIDLITTMPHRYLGVQSSVPELEYYDQLRIRRIPIPKHRNSFLGQSWAFFCYAQQIRKIVRYEKYKVVYASSSRLMMASLAAWIAKPQQATLFLDIRGLFTDTLKDKLPKSVSRYLVPTLGKIEDWSLARAHHVNVVSKGFEPYMQARFPTKTVSCYPNGIDKKFLQHGFKSPDQASEQFTLLYVGNIGEGQGLEHIIPQLAKSLEGCAQIKIIGEGERKIHLEAAIQAAYCTNVELFPHVQTETLLKMYAQADVLFLHLKDSHAFRKMLPAKIFEYAATGKPILAGVVGFAADFIQSEVSNAVVFQPFDTQHALKEIAKLDFMSHEREAFIKKYHRDAIMQNMALALMAYL